MENRLPPLNALKAFESAARHLSVKLAAEELYVTPGAVSQMLKTLEAHLASSCSSGCARHLSHRRRTRLSAVDPQCVSPDRGGIAPRRCIR